MCAGRVSEREARCALCRWSRRQGRSAPRANCRGRRLAHHCIETDCTLRHCCAAIVIVSRRTESAPRDRVLQTRSNHHRSSALSRQGASLRSPMLCNKAGGLRIAPRVHMQLPRWADLATEKGHALSMKLRFKVLAWRGAAPALIGLALLAPSCTSTNTVAPIPHAKGCQVEEDCDRGLTCTKRPNAAGGLCHVDCESSASCAIHSTIAASPYFCRALFRLPPPP
jgi:hypothetical protein